MVPYPFQSKSYTGKAALLPKWASLSAQLITNNRTSQSVEGASYRNWQEEGVYAKWRDHSAVVPMSHIT
ncbi:hypothetical protein BIW11_03318 [Tropilaelaps mercedesae]|uniref:Uncharacterized protein n=1 Tax=Tropilaelaps mercedesae TaxID=418985 RepID=A0A1V9XNJ1_9ACAR|nr:hypothetical protein BIW11_03318 [Tropilaelaps mercedesae]